MRFRLLAFFVLFTAVSGYGIGMETIFNDTGRVYRLEPDLQDPDLVLYTTTLFNGSVAQQNFTNVFAQDLQPNFLATDLSTGSMFDEDVYLDFLQLNESIIVTTDPKGNCLKWFSRSTDSVSTFAGTCSPLLGFGKDGLRWEAYFHNPYAMAKANDTIFVTDHNNRAIRSIGIFNSLVKTLVKTIGRPQGITVDPTGNYLYVTEDSYHTLLKVDINSQVVYKLTSSSYGRHEDGSFLNTHFNHPTDVTFINETLLAISDNSNRMIRIVNLESSTTYSICSGDYGNKDGSILKCTITAPWSVQVIDGFLFVGTDDAIRRISIADLDESLLGRLARPTPARETTVKTTPRYYTYPKRPRTTPSRWNRVWYDTTTRRPRTTPSRWNRARYDTTTRRPRTTPFRWLRGWYDTTTKRPRTTVSPWSRQRYYKTTGRPRTTPPPRWERLWDYNTTTTSRLNYTDVSCRGNSTYVLRYGSKSMWVDLDGSRKAKLGPGLHEFSYSNYYQMCYYSINIKEQKGDETLALEARYHVRCRQLMSSNGSRAIMKDGANYHYRLLEALTGFTRSKIGFQYTCQHDTVTAWWTFKYSLLTTGDMPKELEEYLQNRVKSLRENQLLLTFLTEMPSLRAPMQNKSGGALKPVILMDCSGGFGPKATQELCSRA